MFLLYRFLAFANYIRIPSISHMEIQLIKNKYLFRIMNSYDTYTSRAYRNSYYHFKQENKKILDKLQ